MGRIIGIDLGTSKSCVAVFENGEPVVIKNAEGWLTTPSIAGFTEEGSRVTGQAAKDLQGTNPAKTVYSIKRFMGLKYAEIGDEAKRLSYRLVQSGDNLRVAIGNKLLSPQEISAFILQKMKKTAEDYLGEKVSEAVIAVPSRFSESQRKAVRDAGRIAGLEVKRLVNEASAAALAYGFKKKQNVTKTVAVYDLGGGSFDISIIEISEGLFEVKSSSGDTCLGGDDFDIQIVKWLIDEFKKDTGIDLSRDMTALQRLREAAEKAKIELSSMQTAEINVPYIVTDASGPKTLQKTISREQFEKMIAGLLGRTIEICMFAMKDAALAAEQIDEVILSGGCTRIPAVQRIVQKLFKREPNKSVNPDEAVAKGAAVVGGMFSGDVKDVLLLDVASLSLGLETVGGVMTRIIPRNTTIPVRRSQVFSTSADGQTTVTINVYQGEHEMVSENRLLARFDLVGIQNAPKGVPQIEITFDMDANGMVNVSAKDLGTGKQQQIHVTSSGGLSDEEVERLAEQMRNEQSKEQRTEKKEQIKEKSEKREENREQRKEARKIEGTRPAVKTEAQAAIQGKVCVECKAPLEDDAVFCEECGAEQPQVFYCEECGAEMEAGAKFCEECGADNEQ